MLKIREVISKAVQLPIEWEGQEMQLTHEERATGGDLNKEAWQDFLKQKQCK